jgi:hypothetical protein
MMRSACLILLLACTCPLHAQTPPREAPGGYLSGALGNGRIDGGNASGYRLMRWRAIEVRAGRDLGPALANGAAPSRLDFVYYNEGHPDNNHRDGFALQYTWARKLGERVTAELAAGPYLSMNTTTIGRQEINDANLGILYTAGLRFALDDYAPGTHVRLAFNHVWMREVHRSNAIVLGVGRHFTDVPPFPGTALGSAPWWLGASLGLSVTNQSKTDHAAGAIAEAKKYGGMGAVSLKAIYEGDDGSRVDRRGVAAQYFYVQPVTERWTVSAGLGPYFATNRREDGGMRTLGLISLQFERALSADTKAFFAFHRITTFHETNDRDMYQFGLMRSLGR